MDVEAYEEAIEKFKQVEILAMKLLSMNEHMISNVFLSRL